MCALCFLDETLLETVLKDYGVAPVDAADERALQDIAYNDACAVRREREED